MMENNPIQASILFVCSANMIRSPIAAALFADRLRRKNINLNQWRIESAGTWGNSGNHAMPMAVSIMAERGLDISQHRARRLTGAILSQFNLVLTMEEGQKEALQIEFPACAGKIFLLSEMAFGDKISVEDPVGGTVDDYRQSADEIEYWLENALKKIMRLAERGLD